MKKTKLKILALPILVCVILTSLFAISSAASAAPIIQTAARVTDVNIVQNDKLQLALSVTPTIIMPESGVLGIAVWAPGVEDPDLTNCLYVDFNEKTQGDLTYFKTREIALSDAFDEFYVAACYKLGEEYVLGETPFKYSLSKYLAKRLGEMITEDQAKIYSTLLELAIELADDVETFSTVKAVGGYVGYTTSTLGGIPSQTVLLRADAKNGAGEYFLGWYDENGTLVSDSRLHSVTITETGIATYTAKYGNAEDSLYSSTYDLEQFEAKPMEFTVPSQYTKYSTTGYDSNKTPVWSVSSSGLPGLAITYRIEAVAIGNDQYVYGRTDRFEIKEKSGDKEMFIERGHQIIGYSVTFTDQHEATYAYGGEVDIQFHTVDTNGVGHHVNLTLVDANGHSISLRTNLSYSKTTGEMSMYAEPPSGATRVYAPVSFVTKAGAIITVRAEVDRENKVLDLYANGEHLGNIALEAFSGYAGAIDTFDVTTAYVTKVSVHAISSAKDDITIDNVVFIKGEEIIVQTPDSEENPDGEVSE